MHPTDLPMSDTSTLSTFVASDGDNLAIQDWPLPAGRALRGVVLIVHGLGEHAGRYDALAEQLNDWGFVVRGFDQYGHGESGGVRGGLTGSDRLLNDLNDVVDTTRNRMPRGTPLILLGHGLGGLVAARYAQRAPRKVEALVLSSPALALWLTPWQRLLLRLFEHLSPNVALHSGIKSRWLSHDPAVTAAYDADPSVHQRISARLLRFMRDAAAAVQAAAGDWSVPTLLLYGGADKVVNPAGSRRFAEAAPKQVLSAQCFVGLYHEIFNERGADAVLAHLQQWLDARFSADVGHKMGHQIAHLPSPEQRRQLSKI